MKKIASIGIVVLSGCSGGGQIVTRITRAMDCRQAERWALGLSVANLMLAILLLIMAVRLLKFKQRL